MSFKIKQLIVTHLRNQLNHNFTHKSLKTIPFNRKNLQNNDCLKHKFLIDSNNLDNVLPKDIENSLSKLSFIKQIEVKESNELTPQEISPSIELQIETDFYTKQLLNELKTCQFEDHLGHVVSEEASSQRTVIVEFSSPNIAKPFHVGNFRSTIVGNFVANLYEFCGHNVIRLNYLGDFGTQFGILSLAYDYFGDDKSLADNSLKHLFEVYVKGQAECESSGEWRQSAKRRFHELETKQNSRALIQWQKFRQLSVDQLKSLYHRLGIRFAEFHSESMYSKASLQVIEQMRQLGLIHNDSNGAQFAVFSGTSDENQMKIPVIKSDGSTLYLTRDIAAALHRNQLYDFDEMIYVVDSSQSKHFNNLFKIVAKIDDNLSKKLRHLRFGRIIGMSTRRGEVTFLDDILNEAKERAIEVCRTGPNTKISEENFGSVADILGMSCLVVSDLSHRRVADYRFDWNKALRLTGDTGSALQYSHARLCSLETNCGFDVDLDLEPNLNALNGLEAQLLVNRLAQLEDILIETYAELEPSILVEYLFELRNAINRAHLVLKVKGQSPDLAETRLLLFRCSKNVLNFGMRLLGLKPLHAI